MWKMVSSGLRPSSAAPGNAVRVDCCLKKLVCGEEERDKVEEVQEECPEQQRPELQ